MLCLGKIFENPESNQAWEQRLGWIKSSQNDRSFDRIDGEPMEFEWNIFPGFNSLQLSEEVKRLLLRLDETPENFTGGSYSCRCSTTSPVDQEATKKNVWQMPNSYLCTREDLGKDNGHLLVLVLKRSGTLLVKTGHKEWDNIAERMLVEFAESGCPIFRATSPLSRGQLKSKGHGKLSIHFAADQETIRTFFRTITSVNQLSLYGAVAEICEEYESFTRERGDPLCWSNRIPHSCSV